MNNINDNQLSKQRKGYMNIAPILGAISICVIAMGPTISNAALIPTISPGGIYDSDLDITWLADANANGLMTQADAATWAGSLTTGGAVNWRLPTSDMCFGNNCSGSELGHLYYTELGVTAPNSISSSLDTSFADFTGTWQNDEYWTQTPDGGLGDFFLFNMFDGSQGSDSGFTTYAIAVHDGNIDTIPIPAAVWLFGSGLVGLIGVARRKKAELA